MLKAQPMRRLAAKNSKGNIVQYSAKVAFFFRSFPYVSIFPLALFFVK